MLLPAPPLSNAQRQRDFQARHPGYDRKRKARQRAAFNAAAKAARAAREAMNAPATAQPPALPAPVVDPVMIAMNEMVANLARAKRQTHAPAALVPRSSARPMPVKAE